MAGSERVVANRMGLRWGCCDSLDVAHTGDESGGICWLGACDVRHEIAGFAGG